MHHYPREMGRELAEIEPGNLTRRILLPPRMVTGWKMQGIAAEAATASGKGPVLMTRCSP